MTPADRLYAELWPDGTFGGPPPEHHQLTRTTAEDQTRHYADLERAITPRRTRKAT